MQRPIRGQKPNFVIYGWILIFKVSKNASFQNESFCIKHFFDWRSISGLRRRPPFRGCSWNLGINLGISNRIKVFKVSNDASFQKKYLFIKQFFDWMSTNGLRGSLRFDEIHYVHHDILDHNPSQSGQLRCQKKCIFLIYCRYLTVRSNIKKI